MSGLAWTMVAAAIAVAVPVTTIAAGDRTLFTPPPDSVAENFVRGLTSGRYAPARQHLSAAARVTEADLLSLRQEVEGRVPGRHSIESQLERSDSRRAVSAVMVKGHSASRASLRLSLLFENGRWRIQTITLES